MKLGKWKTATLILSAFVLMACQTTTPHKFVEVGTMTGPKSAEGAIVWMHGWCPPGKDCSTASTPLHITWFTHANWDVFRLNVPPSAVNRDDVGWYVRAQSQADLLVARVKALRKSGYRKMAVAGYSGGAMSVLFAGTMTADIDTVIAVAPCCGVAESGPYIDVFEFYDLLADLRVPRVMLFFFSGEVNAPQNIGLKSEHILKSLPLNYVIHDKPEYFHGHDAGYSSHFAGTFSKEMINFASGADVPTDPSSLSMTVEWSGVLKPTRAMAKLMPLDDRVAGRRRFKISLPGDLGSFLGILGTPYLSPVSPKVYSSKFDPNKGDASLKHRKIQ